MSTGRATNPNQNLPGKISLLVCMNGSLAVAGKSIGGGDLVLF